MKIHKEGYRIIAISILLAAGIYAINHVFLLPYPIFYWLVNAFLVVMLYLVIQFFRVPHRVSPEGDDLIICPADGKVVVISSWIKYCTSCASQMKILNKAKNDFDNIEYFAFDVTNKEIAEFFNVQYQTTLLIFKDNKEVYRSIGETTKELIYDALNSSI